MQGFSLRSFVLGCLVATAILAGGVGVYHYQPKPKPLPVSKAQEIKEGDPVFVTDWDYKDVLAQKVEQLPGLKKTFDVSMTVYTKELVDKLGLTVDHVNNELTLGMYSFEIRVKTVQNRTDCIFNALLDNNLPLDFPEQPLVAKLNGAELPVMKSSLPDPVMKQLWSKRIDNYMYYNRNNYLATANYDPVHPVGPMMMFQPSPDVIVKEFLPGIAWISLTEFGCGTKLIRFLELPDPALWIKKKGGYDYRYRVHLDKEDFIKFTIPRSLIDRILPFIKEAINTNTKKD